MSENIKKKVINSFIICRIVLLLEDLETMEVNKRHCLDAKGHCSKFVC